MLILSRKVREQILIGGNVRVTVLSVKGGRVQIGVEAPSSIGVRRSELPSRSPSTDGENDAAERKMELTLESTGSQSLS